MDKFDANAVGLDSPLTKLVSVTPNDSTDLSEVTRGIHANNYGTVKVIFKGGLDADIMTLTVLEGVTYPWRIRRVLTGGTATVFAGY